MPSTLPFQSAGSRYTAPIVEPLTGDSVACTSQNAGVPVEGLAGTGVDDTIVVPAIEAVARSLHAFCAHASLDVRRTPMTASDVITRRGECRWRVSIARRVYRLRVVFPRDL